MTIRFRRFAALLLLCLFAVLPAAPVRADEAPETVLDGAYSSKLIRSYSGETLQYTIERFMLDKVTCFLTKIVMEDPGRQIGKAQAKWKKDIRYPSDIAKLSKNAPYLVINGSGYVSPTFPWVPPEYPGTARSYWYTPLGALTITDGKVWRDHSELPYYGLTLQRDGLHMHVGEATADILRQEPTQTWSFYDNSPLILDGEIILDYDWDFANQKALRNILFKIDDHTYMDMIVSSKTGRGLTVIRCAEFIREQFHPVWAYNLDGGTSVALLAREKGGKRLKTVNGNIARDFDIMTFSELADVVPFGAEDGTP